MPISLISCKRLATSQRACSSVGALTEDYCRNRLSVWCPFVAVQPSSLNVLGSCLFFVPLGCALCFVCAVRGIFPDMFEEKEQLVSIRRFREPQASRFYTLLPPIVVTRWRCTRRKNAMKVQERDLPRLKFGFRTGKQHSAVGESSKRKMAWALRKRGCS